MHPISVNLFFILVMNFVNCDEHSLTVLVPGGGEECLYQLIEDKKYSSFEMDYQVTSGRATHISLKITSPKGIDVVHDFRKSEGSHRILLDTGSAGRGVYRFCFDNSHNNYGNKVFFEFFLMDASGMFLGDFGETLSVSNDVLQSLDTHVETFLSATAAVKNNLNKVERVQRLYSSLELADRTALETSFEMINFWSTVHLCLMLFSLFIQVFMVRSLFEDDSRVGRILRKGKWND
ncbi:hypothetical protein AB6A40_003549 [Gnathostoma spinigerum]|uniref:GOLD domain-containing protein n=1 Tax=Gnathostoma spinigerum TaxID=75299 RepID=A0ABD6EB22_9BILA